MTLMTVLGETQGETLTAATARRLRGELAERQISNLRLTEKLNVSHTWLTRRTRGQVALSTEDMERIQAATGIDPAYLVTGVRYIGGSDPQGGAKPATGAGPNSRVTDQKRERTYATRFLPDRCRKFRGGSSI